MQLEFNFQKFKEEVIAAVKKAFLEIVEEYKGSTVYAFSLICDSAARFIGAAANTKESLEEQIEGEEDRYYYKFCEQEWEICDAADDEFQKLRNMLVEFQENNEYEISDSETCIYTEFFEEYREKVFNICVQALIEIKNEGFFQNKCNEDVFINFMVPEYLDEEDSIEIFGKINSGKIVKEYKEHIEDFM